METHISDAVDMLILQRHRRNTLQKICNVMFTIAKRIDSVGTLLKFQCTFRDNSKALFGVKLHNTSSVLRKSYFNLKL